MCVLIGLVIVIVRLRQIRTSIHQTKSTIERLKEGDLSENQMKVPENEMKEVVQSLNFLQDNFRNAASFAQRVGKGELNAPFNKLSDKDALGIALIESETIFNASMNKMRKEIGLLPAFHNSVKSFVQTRIVSTTCATKLSNLWPSIQDVIRAGLFLLNNDNEKDEFLEMVACYAFNRKKYLTKRIEKGEGLVGQCFLEGELIILTSVPKNFAKITSGLGEALPNSVMIVPIKVNEKIYGIMELLSFEKFESQTIEFLQKAAESIASVISTIQINGRTR